MTHPAVLAYWVPQHLPDAARLASWGGASWGTMAIAQAVVEAPDSSRATAKRGASCLVRPAAGTATFSPASDGWIDSAPNVRMKWLRKEQVGGTLELLVRRGPGAVHIAPPGSRHPPITTERGALLLLRCEYPFPVG